MRRNQEYIKELDHHKKEELSSLLQREGSKSKFRTKIQMTWLYIIASALMLISLLATNYLLYDSNKLYYLPLIICTIVAFLLYFWYFYRWIKDYKKIKDYVQQYWYKLYIAVFVLTVSAFLISFLCTLIPVAQYPHNSLYFLGGLPYYAAIIVGVVFDILLTIISAALDNYVIYHIEVDLQRIVAEYEEDQVDYLKEKIKQEVNKIKTEESLNINNEVINDNNKQEALTQAEIDKLLKENSLFLETDEDDKEE